MPLVRMVRLVTLPELDGIAIACGSVSIVHAVERAGWSTSRRVRVDRDVEVLSIGHPHLLLRVVAMRSTTSAKNQFATVDWV